MLGNAAGICRTPDRRDAPVAIQQDAKACILFRYLETHETPDWCHFSTTLDRFSIHCRNDSQAVCEMRELAVSYVIGQCSSARS